MLGFVTNSLTHTALTLQLYVLNSAISNHTALATTFDAPFWTGTSLSPTTAERNIKGGMCTVWLVLTKGFYLLINKIGFNSRTGQMEPPATWARKQRTKAGLKLWLLSRRTTTPGTGMDVTWHASSQLLLQQGPVTPSIVQHRYCSSGELPLHSWKAPDTHMPYGVR